MAVIAIHKLSLKSLFIKKFLFIILAMLFSSFGMSNLSAQNNLTETMYDIGTATEDVYKTSKQIVSLTVQLDGRKKLLKKIGYAKKIKKPILKPLQKFFTAVDQSPIGKKVNVIEKGFTISRASVEFTEWATGKDVSPLAFTDSIAELSSLDPSGISDIAKTQVYDRLKKINEKMDEIRASEESTDNAYISIATKLVDEKIFNSIIANFDTSAIQNYQDAEKIYQMANNRYTKSINNSLTLIEQHIKSINNSINTKFTCLALCQAQNEEKKARVRLLSLWRERLNAHKSKNKKELIWTAITEKLVYDTYLLANDWKNSVQFVADQKIKNNETLKLLEFEPSTLPKVHQGKIDNSRIYLSHRENENVSHELKDQIIDDARKKKEDSNENWLGSVTGLHQSPASIFSVTTFGYTESALLHPNVNDVISIEVLDPTSNTGQRLGTVQGRINGKYDHTAWGEWNGKLIVVDHGTGQPTEFEGGPFVAGLPTPKSDIDRRIGNAEFSGQIHGDYASQADGLIATSVTGTIDLTVNFDNDSVSGIIGMVGPNGFSANPQFNANFYDKGPNAVGYSGNLIGANGSGGIDGTFFGKNGEETGGSFHYFKNTGENGTGIFIAKEKK